MTIKELISENEEFTKKIAENIGKNIESPFYIALKGDLGAGKTAFVQGLAKGLETDPSYYVTSPTYNIIQVYPGRLNLVHADLYRIYGIEELELTGFNDILEETNPVLAVEWPEKIENDFDFDLIIEIKIINSDKRKIRLISCGRKALVLLEKIIF
ncbi:MAG: tRNA (adenosine(37)-N6)-threonylcarbamoyltransferase complex ATPase subunit type 1 TsaE [Desulfobacteraceae bacterium]|nr:tRNA (adenosine(37)-N6)-threonylcarbamoyltransferase complex ATPase subunit type 1 TsaE [Desulfobacteraceae bacterium]